MLHVYAFEVDYNLSFLLVNRYVMHVSVMCNYFQASFKNKSPFIDEDNLLKSLFECEKKK